MSKGQKGAAPPPTGDNRKVSGELFVLTYGSLVQQLLADLEEEEAVNAQLDKMGYNIGLRLIDDFLAKNPSQGRCADFRETADVLAKGGFRTYLGVTPTVSAFSPAGDEFTLTLDSNPLTEFVELPGDSRLKGLRYSQLLAGAIRGALEMVHLEVQVTFTADQLQGSPNTQLRVRFVRRLEETVPLGDDD